MESRTSGYAIVSLVLGILGVVCVPFTGFLAVIFGLLGMREISRSERAVKGKGIAITGLVLGVIGAVFTTILSVAIVSAINEGRTLRTPRVATADVPEYVKVVGDGFSGSGFHFEWEGRLFMGCSLHQFDDAVPGEMLVFLGDWSDEIIEVEIEEQVHRLEDVQILRFDESALEGIAPLRYDGEADVRYGELVYIMSADGPLAADVVNLWTGERHMRYARLREPVPLRGTSGSAVVSGVTGHVVGVMLLTAQTDDEELAGFELLELPRRILTGP